jgi:hypothetical protein
MKALEPPRRAQDWMRARGPIWSAECPAAAGLLLQDGYRRDHLSFTWNLKTMPRTDAAGLAKAA